MNDPNACRARFYGCHCELPTGHDGPHECIPDPLCGGSWLRVDTDEPGMTRVFRYPNLRPGCENYEAVRDMADGATDPPAGEYVLEHDGIFRAPRGGITFLKPPTLTALPELAPLEWQERARAYEERLLGLMRSPGA